MYGEFAAVMSGRPVTSDEQIVLLACREFPKSFRMYKNYRFHQAHEATGITLRRWNIAMRCIRSRGWLAPTDKPSLRGYEASRKLLSFAQIMEDHAKSNGHMVR